MKQDKKLRAYYSKKERDIMLAFPLGVQTQSDGHFLSCVFDKKFKEEMERRGYDIETLKFSIEPQKGNQRFAGERI